MRTLALTCLATLVLVTSLAESVEAGRRRRRTRRVAAAASVAAVATPRPRVVAVAPVVVPVPAVVQRTAVVLTPDLTITDISAEGGLHCVSVKNIGQAPSPVALLRISFHRVSDGTLIASKDAQVSPLQVNQSIRFRLHRLPPKTGQLIAIVDPEQKVIEISEKNNDLSFEIAKKQPEVMPTPLDDVDVWVVPKTINGEAAEGQTSGNS